jgi:ribonuclease HI
MTWEKQTAHTGTFMEYLLSQEEHISQYYAQIEFLMVPMKIYELFKSTKRVLIATDGGAIPFKGSIGFVFADEDGNILLTCFGQPSSNDPLSFRSEICAFLAAVRLIKLLTNYYDDRIECNETGMSKIQVYTDSLSMIKKLKAYDKYPTASLTTVLDSEWDVLSALHKALQWFKTYPKISWVKSHQDDKVYDKTEMPLYAYLNSEADELATTGLKRLQEKPMVPMDPDTGIQFHIKGRTITRDFKRTIRETIQLPPLRKFYCERFGWSENIFDIIDWEIF